MPDMFTIFEAMQAEARLVQQQKLNVGSQKALRAFYHQHLEPAWIQLRQDYMARHPGIDLTFSPLDQLPDVHDPNLLSCITFKAARTAGAKTSVVLGRILFLRCADKESDPNPSLELVAGDENVLSIRTVNGEVTHSAPPEHLTRMFSRIMGERIDQFLNPHGPASDIQQPLKRYAEFKANFEKILGDFNALNKKNGLTMVVRPATEMQNATYGHNDLKAVFLFEDDDIKGELLGLFGRTNEAVSVPVFIFPADSQSCRGNFPVTGKPDVDPYGLITDASMEKFNRFWAASLYREIIQDKRLEPTERRQHPLDFSL